MKLPPDLLRACWFLAGPTASGKTALALRLARRIDAEIVSMDSMALYRGMDIGTAKPSPSDRDEVPHHLIDVVEPHEEFSTAHYLERAHAACLEILQRGRTPLFAGGTGLYLRALLRGVFSGPPADPDFRRRLEAEASGRHEDWLHAKLRGVDPESAERLHPNDVRRLIRALEIHHLTGTPASHLQRESPLPPEARPQHVYWLHPPREWLYQRINLRVEQMFEAGLVAEVEVLLRSPSPPGLTARQALGYREVIDFLEGRIPTIEETKELVKMRTRQFAKRQHTWFRNLEECREIAMTGREPPEELARAATAMDGG